MKQLERKTIVSETKSVDRANHEITTVISDESIDSFGDRILQGDLERGDKTGWDLRRYRKYGALLVGHDHQSFPVGVSKKVWVEDKKLWATFRFAADIDERSRQAWNLASSGILRGYSVGFVGDEIEEIKDGDGKTTPRRIFTKGHTLYETSLTALPSNANAIMEMQARSMIDPSLAQALTPRETPRLAYHPDHGWLGERVDRAALERLLKDVAEEKPITREEARRAIEEAVEACLTKIQKKIEEAKGKIFFD